MPDFRRSGSASVTRPMAKLDQVIPYPERETHLSEITSSGEEVRDEFRNNPGPGTGTPGGVNREKTGAEPVASEILTGLT